MKMITSIDDIINAAKTFSIPDAEIEEKENGRKAFLSKFPRERIQSLSVEDYCIGTTENSFCYWLEFKSILFGIGGGNASKFGIYKSKDGNYYQELGEHKRPLDPEQLKTEFSKIINAIVQGLKLVEEDKIREVILLDTSIWNIVFLKIFALYFPEKFLTIGDPSVIIECAKSIGVKGVEFKNENSIILNFLCRQKINETPEFSNWEYEKIGAFIWELFRNTSKRDYYLIGSKYGENANQDMFPLMLKNSVVSTGFAANIDLTEFYNETQTTIKRFLLKQGEENNSISALKHFLSIRPGDLIAVKSDGSPKGKQGYLSIVAIAEATEINGKVYEYNPTELGHTINVKYLEAPILKELSLGGYGRTIHRLTNDEHIKLIFSNRPNTKFFSELKKFIEQSKTSDLKRAEYVKSYAGLSVKVSFGQGNQANVPWIAFLSANDTVQNGIYPVYLYYKDRDVLILAYGVSETYLPNRSWPTSNEKLITDYFKEHNLGIPERYGSSYVYKAYDLRQPLIEAEIEHDLTDIVLKYKSTYEMINIPKWNRVPISINEGLNAVSVAGLNLGRLMFIRFVAALMAKPFVILTGLSGSGKTKLAQAFAKWICEDQSQYKLVPIGADWTNREPLLGFPNALITDEYKKDDFGVLQLIIDAVNNPEKPHFLILDEMNLSHVERYFADFLSAIESKEKISLHEGPDSWNNVPPEMCVPKNLFIVGTVNIDETTYMFSPKVLDRANVIEFRISREEMLTFIENQYAINLDLLEGKGAAAAHNFLKMAQSETPPGILKEFNTELIGWFDSLKVVGAEFGYRSAFEISRLLFCLKELDKEIKPNEILDIAIMQKMLPKLHGSRTKLLPVLEKLGQLCLNADLKWSTCIENREGSSVDWSEVKYKLSFEKILRMYWSAIDNGFASYAEA